MFGIKNKKINLGNVVTFNFVGYINGVKFPGGSGDAYELKIGSGEFIDGFETKMIGLKKGEKKDVVVPFPKDYHDTSLAGKLATFKVEIISIK